MEKVAKKRAKSKSEEMIAEADSSVIDQCRKSRTSKRPAVKLMRCQGDGHTVRICTPTRKPSSR